MGADVSKDVPAEPALASGQADFLRAVRARLEAQTGGSDIRSRLIHDWRHHILVLQSTYGRRSAELRNCAGRNPVFAGTLYIERRVVTTLLYAIPDSARAVVRDLVATCQGCGVTGPGRTTTARASRNEANDCAHDTREDDDDHPTVFVPDTYIESSGTRMASISAQSQTPMPTTAKRPKMNRICPDSIYPSLQAVRLHRLRAAWTGT
jgi:hypothetical protein